MQQVLCRNPEYPDSRSSLSQDIYLYLLQLLSNCYSYSSNFKDLARRKSRMSSFRINSSLMRAGSVLKVLSGPLSKSGAGVASRCRAQNWFWFNNWEWRDYQIFHTFCLRSSILFCMIFNEITRCVQPVSLNFLYSYRNLSTTQQTTMNIQSIQPKSSYFQFSG